MFKMLTKFFPDAANFEKAVFAGYSSAELHLTPVRLMSWRSLSKIARSYDMDYVMHFPTSGKRTESTCEEIVQLARDINCNLVSVHEVDLSLADRINRIDPEIRLAVENQDVARGEIDSWIQSFELITLNIDYLWKYTLGHCSFSELSNEVRRLFQTFGNRIASVHLSGIGSDRTRKYPLSESPDTSRMLWDLLAEVQYAGVVVAELDVTFQTAENLTRDLTLFQDWQVAKGILTLDSCPNLLGTAGPVGELL